MAPERAAFELSLQANLSALATASQAPVATRILRPSFGKSGPLTASARAEIVPSLAAKLLASLTEAERALSLSSSVKARQSMA